MLPLNIEGEKSTFCHFSRLLFIMTLDQLCKTFENVEMFVADLEQIVQLVELRGTESNVLSHNSILKSDYRLIFSQL